MVTLDAGQGRDRAGRVAGTPTEHPSIIEAFWKRDSRKARSLMEVHILEGAPAHRHAREAGPPPEATCNHRQTLRSDWRPDYYLSYTKFSVRQRAGSTYACGGTGENEVMPYTRLARLTV